MHWHIRPSVHLRSTQSLVGLPLTHSHSLLLFSPTSTKAIHIPTYTPDPSTLQPSYIPTPNPKADELLIRITHCSPQHADILHAQGKHQNNNAKKGWCFPPFTLGYDFAGVVHTLPPSGAAGVAGGLKKGDRVFGAAIGAFAEFVCVKKGALRKVPDGLSNETACAMVGQAVSYASVVRIAKVQPGETVMVSGASGGLGGVCCMVAKACGARVVALVGDEGKAALMRESLGVDAVVVMREGGGGGCLAYFGRIVILGFAARKGVMEEVKMNKLLLKSATVVGYRFGESGRRFPKELEEIWDGYLGMMQEGRLKPLLDGRYDGLENVGRALGDLAARKVYGKIVVKVADEEETAKL
ncbi:hypothetical protein LTR03_006752 [Friedmanniomyces endolithicus]|nr:hypothetical protein LTR03_006752 [Friedmanniomyces endolithicus]